MINLEIRNRLTCNLYVKKAGTLVSTIAAKGSHVFSVPGDFLITDVILLESENTLSRELIDSYPCSVQQSTSNILVIIRDIEKKPQSWEITFIDASIVKPKSETDVVVMAKASTTNNSTVTVGQDEPTLQIPLSATICAASVGFGLGLVIAPYIKEFSPVLWGGLIGLSAVVGLVSGIMNRKK